MMDKNEARCHSGQIFSGITDLLIQQNYAYHVKNMEPYTLRTQVFQQAVCRQTNCK